MIRYKNHIVNESLSIRDVLSVMNELDDALLTLFVTDAQGVMTGTITDGDIRRGLVAGASVTDPVGKVMNRNFKFIRKSEYDFEQFHLYKKDKIDLIPIIDDQGKITGVKDISTLNSLLPMDAVIMAGGDGVRLRPLTLTTPKPLLKVGDKPIIEHNIDRLISYGVNHFSVTVRYLGEQIEAYFADGAHKNVSISYIRETDALGTVGAISLIDGFVNDSVLIMNSDILTNIDYEDFYLNFVQQGADMMIAAVPYQVKIPYAVLETNKNKVYDFSEKPTYTYHSNGGIYLVKRHLLDLIPKGRKFDATDFMQLLIEKDYHVLTYSMVNYWLDIGRHEDFVKAQEDIKHLTL